MLRTWPLASSAHGKKPKISERHMKNPPLSLPLPARISEQPPSIHANKTPNVVVIFIDDMGYADIGPFGAKAYPTPHLDRMAKEGRKFTDFYVTQAVCSASRAGLLTGCYNVRVGILGALGPKSSHGINANEVTLAEICKQKGYATACYGKWHLGHHKKFLPMQHGFDDFFGLPYSNDMWPYHPGVLHLPMKERLKKWPHLPLIEKNKSHQSLWSRPRIKNSSPHSTRNEP